MSVFIIAEAGVNHNGNFKTALALADAAKKAGADCIKFQTFKASSLVSHSARTADYQKKAIGESSQESMLSKLELTYDEFRQLKAYCDQIGICFLSTPFDFDSIEFLKTFDMPFWKIPSGEVTNLPYLIELAKTGKPVVLSTGMCTEADIHAAIHILKANGASEITLLQCNTEYPTPYQDVNLRAMNTMKKTFGVETGYSDHTEGIEVSLAAAALGARVIEKHFTLDRNMEGPDHKASIEPQELALLVKSIRHIEEAMGSGIKQPSHSEKKNIEVARKSIVAKKAIKKGEVFSEENLTTKRPGSGISPMRWFEVLGKTARQDYEEDEVIQIKEMD